MKNGLKEQLLLEKSYNYDSVLCGCVADVDFDGQNEILLGTFGQVCMWSIHSLGTFSQVCMRSICPLGTISLVCMRSICSIGIATSGLYTDCVYADFSLTENLGL